MYYTRFFRDAAPDGAGGLQGLVEGLNELPGEPIIPTETPDEIAAKATAAEQTALKAEALEADGSLKPGYLKAADGKLSKDPNYTAPAVVPEEGLDADGNLLPGYRKDADGKVIIDPAYEPAEMSEEEETTAFFERVNAITGDALDIEYPEGISPLSPEGIAHYTQVIREDAAIQFENYLAQKDPRAWAYMLHRNGGGTDEEFLSGNKGFVLPEKEQYDASADLQASVFKYNLKAQGLDDESIDILVKKAITDNKLKEKADAAYKYIDDAQKEELNSINKQSAERDQQTDQAIAGYLGKVDKAIAGELKFMVPDSDKPAFKQFVIDNLRYDENTKTFSLVQQIPDDKLNTILESLFFQHKGGNLKALVEKQAKTIAAQGLRLKLKGVSGGPGSGAGSTKDEGSFVPLSAMTVNS